MFKWNKKGLVFNPKHSNGNNWMKEFAQSPSVLIYDDYIRVYFCTRPDPDSKGQYMSYVGYIDVERNNLLAVRNICTGPVLSLGKLGTFDEFGTNPASLIRNGDEIRMYYAGWTRCESVPFNAAIGLAVSHNNGVDFSRIGDGPVLSYSLDEPFVLGSPKIRSYNNKWYLWYAAGKKWLANDERPEPVYKIRMAVSDDGINWEKIGKDLLDSVLEENECQASPDVIYFNNKYHMFFSYRYNFGFQTKGRGYRMGYASSDDLINWTRDDGKIDINVSDNGWDSEMISYGHVFELDGKVYMFYLGNGVGRTGFGLAELEMN